MIRKPDTPSDTILWRYLTHDKFLWLIKERGLYLAQAARFVDDPLEGAVTAVAQAQRQRFQEEVFGCFNAGEDGAIMQDQRNMTYASCWHENTAEDFGMWTTYCTLPEGIVVVTTFAKLDEACLANGEQKFFLGEVEYTEDWKKEYFYPDNPLSTFTHKDVRFENEREARVLHIMVQKENFVKMPVDLESLIDHIYVHPLASEEYYGQVKSLLQLYAPSLVAKLEWSKLRGFVMADDL